MKLDGVTQPVNVQETTLSQQKPQKTSPRRLQKSLSEGDDRLAPAVDKIGRERATSTGSLTPASLPPMRGLSEIPMRSPVVERFRSSSGSSVDGEDMPSPELVAQCIKRSDGQREGMRGLSRSQQVARRKEKLTDRLSRGVAPVFSNTIPEEREDPQGV